MEIKSSVTKSPHFAEIMASYDKFGRRMSVLGFWKKYVAPLDENIKYQIWNRYASKIDPKKKIKIFAVTEPVIEEPENQEEPESLLPVSAPPIATQASGPLDKIPMDFPNTIDPMPGQKLSALDNSDTNANMEESSLRNIFAISEHTLDELVTHPELLVAIPVKERMKWLFSAMKARDSRMVALTKVQSEKRKTSLYEDMIQGAQYGEVDEDEFDDNSAPKSTQESPQSTHEVPSETINIEKKPIKDDNQQKIVQFDPKDL